MPQPPLSQDKLDEAWDAWVTHGSVKDAALSLGIPRSTLQNRLAKCNAVPTEAIPDDHRIKGVSTFVDAGGNTRGQWIKTQQDADIRQQAFTEAVEAAKESIPRATPEKPPQRTESDLCACYVLSDAHIGMLAFSEETGGDNWDTQIAEETLTRWIYSAIQSAPKAHTGLLLQLGDWLHFDGLIPETPSSRHSLDTDTRFQLLIRVAVRVLRRIISLMLRKHQHVHIIMADANHDPASSAWLREVFATLYEDEKRVTVDTSADTYYAFRWGDVSLFAHHGHKAKMSEVSRTFAGKFREMYGQTTYSYAHVGHCHHTASTEDPMMITEQHSALAARDAYASKMGFVNQRGAQVITYHRQWGEVGRTMIRPEMLK